MKKLLCITILIAVCLSVFSCVERSQPDQTDISTNPAADTLPAETEEASGKNEPKTTEPPETDAVDETKPYSAEEPGTEPYVTEPKETEPPETETVVTDPPVTEPKETDPPVTDPPKPREFNSVQSSHTTPDSVEKPTYLHEYGPRQSDEGVSKMFPAKVYFQIYDCGYEQFEKLLGWHDFYDKSLISPDTAKYREKILKGEFKVWLCTLDGEKIDYVYANRNGIVGFTLYPGEYRVMYEDDGTYKTLYSTVVKVERVENKNGPATSAVKIVNPLGYFDDTLRLHVYNYKWYKPVTVTVKDDATGKPLSDVYVAYQSQYLSEEFKDRYYKTDKNGKLHLSCIFDFIEKVNLLGMNSWHSDISFYFEKEGYDSIRIKTDKTTETEFTVSMHKTEKFEYTVKVINLVTGEPVKGAKLNWGSGVQGEFIISESGADGILKGYVLSSDLKDSYGESGRTYPTVRVSIDIPHDQDSSIDNVSCDAPVWQLDWGGPFVMLYTPPDTATKYLGDLRLAGKNEKAPYTVPLASIYMSGDDIVMKVGGTVKLDVIFYPENAVNKNLVWRIERGSSCGEVNENGEFTALQEGSCTVRVESVTDYTIHAYQFIKIIADDAEE